MRSSTEDRGICPGRSRHSQFPSPEAGLFILAGRYLPVRDKSPEVIEPHPVIQLQGMLHTPYPPAVPVAL